MNEATLRFKKSGDRFVLVNTLTLMLEYVLLLDRSFLRLFCASQTCQGTLQTVVLYFKCVRTYPPCDRAKHVGGN